MFCKKCGKEIQAGWSNCPNCGNKIEKELQQNNVINVTQQKLERTKKKGHLLRNIIIVVATLFVAFWVLVIILAVTDDGSAAEESIQKHQKANKETQSTVPEGEKKNQTEGNTDKFRESEPETMTINEYLQSCTRVSNTDLARNPEMYEGKDIILEGELSILADEVTIGWFEDTGIIKVNYDRKAVDADGNEIGNVVSGDYGLVAGKYGNEDSLGQKYIDAAIIILNKE